jgi:cell fate regulator YaaT (PSP1 superfamily)
MAVDHDTLVAGVRFNKVGKIYHFDASRLKDLKIGDPVIVETARGTQLGIIHQLISNGGFSAEGTIKPIVRQATPRDLLIRQTWKGKEPEVNEYLKVRVKELKINLIKLVGSEFSYDGSKLTILYSSETEEKIDLKSLRQDLQKRFSPVQVDLRQVGPRDVAKILCGMGACGIESRCCSRFLCDFNSISIRMAKEQDVSLTPSEITGMCGRLRCCLLYEYEQYQEARKNLPKRNKMVITPMGEGKVVDVMPLSGNIVVEIPEIGRKEFHFSDLVAPGQSPSQGEIEIEAGNNLEEHGDG